jgi:hypothetical protein
LSEGREEGVVKNKKKEGRKERKRVKKEEDPGFLLYFFFFGQECRHRGVKTQYKNKGSCVFA